MKHLQRTAGAQGEREVELSLKLEQQADALAQGERERQRLEAAAAAARRESDAQREAGSAAVANEAAAAMALRTTLGALRAADSELQVARGEWLSRQRRLLVRRTAPLHGRRAVNRRARRGERAECAARGAPRRREPRGPARGL